MRGAHARLVDASESMALPSGEGEGESRFGVAARLVDERLVAAAGDAEVVRFAFDERLRLLGDGETPQAVGQRSRLVDALTELVTYYAEGALAAVVVFDGRGVQRRRWCRFDGVERGRGARSCCGDRAWRSGWRCGAQNAFAAGADGADYGGEGWVVISQAARAGAARARGGQAPRLVLVGTLQGMTLDKTAAATENSLASSRPLCNACISNRNRMWLDGAKGQAHSSPAASAEGLYLA